MSARTTAAGHGDRQPWGADEVTLTSDQRPRFIAHHVVPIDKLVGVADLSRIITVQQIFRPHSMELPAPIKD